MLFLELLVTLPPEDQSSVSRIYEVHRELIYKTAYRVLHDHHDSEDILNDVMVSVIERYDKFKGKSERDIISQLVIYSRNAAYNLYGKNKRHKDIEVAITFVNEEDDLEDIEIEDYVPSLEDVVVDKDTSQIVNKHINNLPDIYRDVLSLIYNFGYSNVEIAQVFKTTPNAIGLRIYKAKKKLLKLAGDELRGLANK